MTDIFGTLGPACDHENTLRKMFSYGMNGIRLNLSHTTLQESLPSINRMHEAAEAEDVDVNFVIDMQGPELRTGRLKEPLSLKKDEEVSFGNNGIPLPPVILPYLKKGQRFTIDDAKLYFEMKNETTAVVLRGGTLLSRKSIALEGIEIDTPVLTNEDLMNLDHAEEYGIKGIMQPFVRSAQDIRDIRTALKKRDLNHIRILAKIENQTGLSHLDEIMQEADEIVIARGDLGTCMPLWHLPAVQKEISEKCLAVHKPFMVVTEMLASMEQNPVPTRAEVSDIFHAITDGASAVMVTGETASGKYPDEVIRYLVNTVKEAEQYLKKRS